MPFAAMLACLLLQNTWVVDDNGGPGVDFTDLPPAIAAAADGDLVLVKAGTYTHFVLVGKGLRILGEGAGFSNVSLMGPVPPGITRIVDVPPTSLAYVDRLRFEADTFNPTLRILGSTTRAILADLSISPPFVSFGAGFSEQPVLLVDEATVHLIRSFVASKGTFSQSYPLGSALVVSGGALVHVSSSDVLGGHGQNATCGFSMCGTGNGDVGMVVSGDGTGTSTRVWIAGGHGGSAISPFSLDTGGAGAAGILLNSAFLRVSGDASTIVAGGSGGCGTFNPIGAPGAPGIDGIGSPPGAVHGDVTVVGGTSCYAPPPPAIGASGISIRPISLPVLEVGGTLTLGGTVTFTVSNAPTGSVCVVAVADGPAHFGIPGPFVGEFLLEPPATLFLVGTTSPAGTFSVSLPLAGVPPSFAHVPLLFQAAAFDAPSGLWLLSNATAVALRP